jgi:acyl-CoA synthetase (AMP-forming)/AMP-acid ligase II
MATPNREAAVGEPGELYVAGPTVATAYWGDPEQTAQRFIPTAAGRAYRTGDIVVRGDDGLLYFRGRLDRQVKTRGHRVELEEVETVLRAHPAVIDAVVSATPDDAGSNRLTAVVTTRHEVTVGELRRGCGAALPGYAIPTAFRIVSEFPLTSNGKVDRAVLSVQCGQQLA